MHTLHLHSSSAQTCTVHTLLSPLNMTLQHLEDRTMTWLHHLWELHVRPLKSKQQCTWTITMHNTHVPLIPVLATEGDMNGVETPECHA